jgi:hypothetical protein
VSGPPRLAFGLAKEAARAFGDAAVCNLRREHPLFRSLLEACERKVPEAEMVSHEEVLVGIGRVDEWWRVLSSGERDGGGLVGGLVGDGMGWPARALVVTGGGEVGVLGGFMDRDMVAWDANLEGGVVWMFTNGAA